MDSSVVRIVNKWNIALGMFVIVWVSMHLMLNHRNILLFERNVTLITDFAGHVFHCSFVSFIG